MTSIPIKKHASSIAHRDFSLCLSLYSDASIPFLKRKWSRIQDSTTRRHWEGVNCFGDSNAADMAWSEKSLSCKHKGLFNPRAHV